MEFLADLAPYPGVSAGLLPASESEPETDWGLIIAIGTVVVLVVAAAIILVIRLNKRPKQPNPPKK